MQRRVLLSAAAVAGCLVAGPSGAKPGMLPIILAVRSPPPTAAMSSCCAA